MSSRHLMFVRRRSRWISFLHTTFAISFVLVGGGIVALPFDWSLRGGLATALVALVWSSLTLADTIALVSQNPLRAAGHANRSGRRA
ncbi:hypothetical protein [Bradyrhizobium sp. HKCCYLS20291]|uniref:hypothetical protein n=1 Tax=Bradyrhizobium sp. HKCCYLS20291 TaxID=3420766 RepID=UPI003EBF9A77